MPEWWPAVVFGWPTVVVSLVLAAAGIVFRLPALLFGSAVFAAPFSYYLSGAERWVALPASAIPFVLVAGAYAVKHRLDWLAWCLLTPFLGVAIWLAVVVVSQ